jgi:hypothetical protein
MSPDHASPSPYRIVTIGRAAALNSTNMPGWALELSSIPQLPPWEF